MKNNIFVYFPNKLTFRICALFTLL